MSSQDSLFADRSLKLHEWMDASFARLKVDPDFLPVYQRFLMREIEHYPEAEGMEFNENRDVVIEPDNEEPTTHGQLLETLGKEFIAHYVACLADGHIPQYAEVYARYFLSDGYEPRVSALAYEVIGAKNPPWTAENLAYQDAFHACRFQGKNEEFAKRCAEMLPDYDFHFKSAFEATANYEKNIAKSLSQGRSVTFAYAYAKAWNSVTEVEEVALNYADCFEKLLGVGRSSAEADSIANAYATKHLEGYVADDESDLEFEFAKEEAMAKAESAFRFRGLPAEDKKLPELFLRICQRKYPLNHAKSLFDEIETLARSVLAGHVKLEDILNSPYIEFLEQERKNSR